MENSIELCENVSVTASENTNNSEIESKTIDEDNKMSEEVTANLSEIKEKEVKALNTKKSFKWTNEATKAAACMLKDIIDEYNKANSDLSSSLDENTDTWGFDKLNEQMKVLKQSIELDLYPEEWCRFKLASLIKKYFDEHTNSIKNLKYYDSLWGDIKGYCLKENRYNYFESDFNILFIVLSQIEKFKIDFQEIVKIALEDYENEGGFGCLFNVLCDNGEDFFKENGLNWSIETFCSGKILEIIYHYYVINRSDIEKGYKIDSDEGCKIKSETGEKKYFESDKKEDIIKINKFISIPKEFQAVYIEDLYREKIYSNLPSFKDISRIKDSCNNLFFELMMILASCAYRSINFLTLADFILTNEINNLKGLKETYSSMFEE